MSKTSSKVWLFFQIHKEDDNKAICNLCQMIVSRGGSGKSASTSPLLKHLQRHHDDKYNEIITAKTKISEETQVRCSRTQQPTLSEFLQNTKTWDINDQRSKRINYKIAEMICLDNQPYSIVENTGFMRLLYSIVPQYHIPSRKYFTDNVVPDIYNKIRDKISTKLINTKWISFTSDIWTCTNTNESFLSITAHWITEVWEKQNVVLSCDKLTGNHTGLSIADIITTLIKSWGIGKEKVHLLLRDSGANIVKACNDANINSEGCFIHKLQLIMVLTPKEQYQT